MKKRFLSLVMGIMIVSSVITGCGSSAAGNATVCADTTTAEAPSYSGSSSKGVDMYEEELACEAEYDDYDSINGVSFAASEEACYEDSTDSIVADSSSATTNTGATLDAEDKLVYTADLTIETLDFDQTYSQLTDLVKANGGRIESENYDAQYSSYTSDSRYRSGYHTTRVDYLTVRIPSANYNNFMAADSTLGNITNKTQSLTNITQQYYSTTTRIELLEGQKEYYMHQLELIEQQLMDCQDYEYVIDQMVDLEDRIISVQNEINSLSGSVKTMDMSVAYSTITIKLEEVKEYTEITPVVEEEEDTFLTRLKATVKGSISAVLRFLEGVLTVLIYILPFALIFGGVTLGCIAIIKGIIKKSKARKAQKITVEAPANTGSEEK